VTLAQNGAHHFVVSDLRMGDLVDLEPNSLGSTTFEWDDMEGTDDEDGIVSDLDTLEAGGFTTLSVNASDQSILNAWIDFNGNGEWNDAGEHVLIDMPCYPGNNNLAVNIPRAATDGETGLRVRLAPVAGLDPTGIAIGGEVEDHGVLITGGQTTSVDDKDSALPDAFGLKQNYPNPFNPTTTIPFELSRDAEVEITIYNILGMRIRTLIHGQWTAGAYNMVWNGINDRGQGVPTGIYIYRIVCRDMASGRVLHHESKKMMMMK
jgi:hypothetical protein